MKVILPFISGTGTALDRIAQACFDGVLKDVAKITYVISDLVRPPGFVVAKKWGFVPIGVPFCPMANDNHTDWSRRIITNSFWFPLPDLVIFAGFKSELTLPPEYECNKMVIEEEDDPVVFCELIRARLVGTVMPQQVLGHQGCLADDNHSSTPEPTNPDPGIEADPGVKAE